MPSGAGANTDGIRMFTKQTVPEKTIRQIRTYHSSLCKNKVSRTYTSGQLRRKSIDVYFVSLRDAGKLRSSTRREELMGFLLAEHQKNSLYIHVVCARRGHGGRLFEAAKKYALAQKKKTMSLSSVKNARAYWKRLHFEDLPTAYVCGSTNNKHRIVGSDEHGYRMSLCLKKTRTSTSRRSYALKS